MLPPRPNLRILYITGHVPYAQAYGAQLRVLNLARQLGKLGRVSMVLVLPEGFEPDGLASTREEFCLKYIARTRPAPHRGLIERVRHELDPDFMNTNCESVSEEDRRAVQELMAQHDVVWVHTVRVANAFRIHRWPHTVLDIDDLPSGVYKTGTQKTTLARSLLDRRMAFIWSRRERALRKRFDVLAVCNPSDRDQLQGDTQVHLVRNGFSNPTRVVSRCTASPPRLGFIGLMQYAPNRLGIEWFIERVWPSIRRQTPAARLRVVGRGAEMLAVADDHIDLLGYLEDPAAEISTWSGMIVPIRTGGGTRMKIADAFSKRCPVVSTSFGADGYEVKDGDEVLLADEPAGFAQACVRLLNDHELGERLAASAWQRFSRQWTWDAIGSSAAAAVGACAAAMPAPSADCVLPG